MLGASLKRVGGSWSNFQLATVLWRGGGKEYGENERKNLRRQ